MDYPLEVGGIHGPVGHRRAGKRRPERSGAHGEVAVDGLRNDAETIARLRSENGIPWRGVIAALEATGKPVMGLFG